MTIGEKLKELRKKKGYSVREVADRTEISHSYISKIENDKRDPSFKTVKQLADFYNVNIAYLFIEEQEWFKVLPPRLQEFVKEENLEYLEVGLKAKERGWTADAIQEVIDTVTSVSKMQGLK